MGTPGYIPQTHLNTHLVDVLELFAKLGSGPARSRGEERPELLVCHIFGVCERGIER
jgi:hypothetical protein